MSRIREWADAHARLVLIGVAAVTVALSLVLIARDVVDEMEALVE